MQRESQCSLIPSEPATRNNSFDCQPPGCFRMADQSSKPGPCAALPRSQPNKFLSSASWLVSQKWRRRSVAMPWERPLTANAANAKTPCRLVHAV
jgi:hypothetical protein